MRRQQLWRVRVRKAVEDWVDVTADTPLQAEELAASIPNVISVFGKSAISGMKPVGQTIPVGVEDDEED